MNLAVLEENHASHPKYNSVIKWLSGPDRRQNAYSKTPKYFTTRLFGLLDLLFCVESKQAWLLKVSLGSKCKIGFPLRLVSGRKTLETLPEAYICGYVRPT